MVLPSAPYLEPLGVDMNDWGNILLRDEIVRFQADISRNEAIYGISPTDRARQRTLQALAHSLDLDYEYSVREQLARITKPETPSSGQASILDPTMHSLGGFMDKISNNNYLDYSTSDVDCTSAPSIVSNQFHSVNPSFSDNQNLLHDITADLIDWNSFIEEHPVNDVLSTQHPSDTDGDGTQANNAQIQYQTSMTHLNSSPQTAGPDDLDSAISADEQLLHDHIKRLQRVLAGPYALPDLQATPSHDGSSTSSTINSRAGSRASSINSFSSNRSRNKVSKFFSRRSSVHRRDSSVGYKEIVFDSNPSRPESRASVASGRTGPLDAIARAAMKAVKAVGGACWRCKFLRKQCDSDSPCVSCPKDSRESLWWLIGCRRGVNLATSMPAIRICGKGIIADTVSESYGDCNETIERLEYVNSLTMSVLESRQEEIINITIPDMAANSVKSGSLTDSDPFLTKILNKWPSLNGGQIGNIVAIHQPTSYLLAPLDECIFTIFWEVFYTNIVRPHISIEGSYNHDDFVLLRAAALHQTKHCNDLLISQSLICLRRCLEVLRIKRQLGGQVLLEPSLHATCDAPTCKVFGIADLTSALSIYLAELSRVIFKKENMHGKAWWLSTFYSLCIQSKVRKCLMNILDTESSGEAAVGAAAYMHLAVQLFVASSRSYDPMIRLYVEHTDNALAQTVVRQEHWASEGIYSSADYIYALFEISKENQGSGATRKQINEEIIQRDQLESAKRENESLRSRIQALEKELLAGQSA